MTHRAMALMPRAFRPRARQAAESAAVTFRLGAPRARAANLRQQVGLQAFPPLWRVPLRLAPSQFRGSPEAALSLARVHLLGRQFLRHLRHPARLAVWEAKAVRQVVVSLQPVVSLRLAARTARGLRQAAVTRRAAAVSCRD